MGATAGKGSVLGLVLWCAATAVPIGVAAFLIYDKQRSMAHAGPAAPAPVVSRQSEAEPAAAERVVVAARYADPEQLKQKKQNDALLRPRAEAAQRQAEAREAMKQVSGDLKPTGNRRPSTVGPPPEPPLDSPFPPAASAPAAGSSTGPRIYGLPEDAPPAPPQPTRVVRRR